MVTFARFGVAGTDRLAEWFATFDPQIVAFDEVQSDAAFAAFTTYGKGMASKAKLNFGDCASYALAKQRSLALLYKGDDFAATDVTSAA